MGLPEALSFQQPLLTRSASITAAATSLRMGLYDTPLPPRPPPREENEASNKEGESEEEEDVVAELSASQRLFQMKEDGREGQNLLPPLSRRLDTGIDCYFEVTDRKVQNLAEQASCNPVDAAWALEACKGDLIEARTCISVAQRMALEEIEVELRKTQDKEADDKENEDEISLERSEDKKTQKDNNKNDSGLKLDDVKAELYDMLREDEWKEMAEERMNRRIYEKRMDAFKGSGKDAQWLPGKENPRPVDDEPWFTG